MDSSDGGSVSGQRESGPGPVSEGGPGNEGGDSDAGGGCGFGASRDPLAQPFASDSIWNTPIGSGAQFVPANIAPAASWGGLSADEDVLILTPTAPATAVEYQGSWAPPRCTATSSQVFFTLPMPSNFVIDDTCGTPNGCLAGLMPDGRTIVSGQPFARCTAGGYATMTYQTTTVDLYGDGIAGSHGGSGLSAYGGTLRVGELRPGGCPPRHALKIELDGSVNYKAGNTSSTCYTWPASTCDSYGPSGYGGNNPYLKPGALLALPPSTTIASLGLETPVATLLAWTLQNYGAYIVDDTGWSVYGMATERGPAGEFIAQFQSDYGYPFAPQPVDPTDASPASQWTRDVNRIFMALAIVTNSGQASIGGGGTPAQPLAPAIAPP
jgi:hypothetical protein